MPMTPRSFITLSSAFIFANAAVAASLTEAEIQHVMQIKIQQVEKLASSQVVVDAVKLQNAQKLSLAQIQQRDNEWKASKADYPLKQQLQQNQAGMLLHLNVSKYSHIYNEMFLTDNQGANVAVYPPTTDYWQGDEEKFTAAFNNGAGKVFIGPVELDQSTNTHASQISVPVKDGGATIGVLVVGVKLSHTEHAALTLRNASSSK